MSKRKKTKSKVLKSKLTFYDIYTDVQRHNWGVERRAKINDHLLKLGKKAFDI